MQSRESRVNQNGNRAEAESPSPTASESATNLLSELFTFVYDGGVTWLLREQKRVQGEVGRGQSSRHCALSASAGSIHQVVVVVVVERVEQGSLTICFVFLVCCSAREFAMSMTPPPSTSTLAATSASSALIKINPRQNKSQ